MKDLAKDLKSYIVTTFLFGQESELDENTSFLDKGIIDSTGVLDLVTHLESVYGITVQDDELVPENLDSIGAMVAFVERKKAAAQA